MIFWPEAQYPIKHYCRKSIYVIGSHIKGTDANILVITSVSSSKTPDCLRNFSCVAIHDRLVLKYNNAKINILNWISYDKSYRYEPIPTTRNDSMSTVVEYLNSACTTKPFRRPTERLNTTFLLPKVLYNHLANIKECSVRSMAILSLDFILGTVLYHYVFKFIDIISLLESLITNVRSQVYWLMNSPAGVKLNIPLATLLGSGSDMVLSSLLVAVSALYSINLSFTSSSVIGLSLQLATYSDISKILVSVFYLFARYFARLHQLQLNLLGTLWKLFLGKNNF